MPGPRPDERFTRGLELFNHREYFECHEVIEDLWLETPETNPYRDLYKGVIQAAAAIYQWDRGILTGARGLCRTSVGYLDKYGDGALGLNTRKLASDMRTHFTEMERWDGASALPRNENRTPVLQYETL